MIDEIIGKEFLQNCGDSLIVLEKTDKRDNNKRILYKVQFKKYFYIDYKSKRDILRGSCINPEIERIEFIEKIHPQNCGDSLKIIRKTNEKYREKEYLWECEFINIPYKLLETKTHILSKNVNNPLIEQNDFINKIWLQNCGDSIKILKKSDKKFIDKNHNFYLFECEFINYPYKFLGIKNKIIEGIVDNPNLPWKSKENLQKYIEENFQEKPTLEELSEKINKSKTFICNQIILFDLKDLIHYYPEGSNFENEIKLFVQNCLKDKNIENSWKELDGKEIDIYISNLNFGIECNGNYWHSNEQKENNYHKNKSILAQKKGIDLIHIWEWEWINKENLIKGYLKAKLGLFKNKIGARQCQIKELSYREYAQFCNQNHLQGEAGAKVKLGLFYKKELIQIMSFGSPRFTNKYEWEIIRECSKENWIILGGKEKLWNYFKKKYNPNSVISYCDFSKFKGDSYLRLGFNFVRLNEPGFVWWKKGEINIYWRNPSEHKNFIEKDYLRLYDCGQLVFEWYK